MMRSTPPTSYDLKLKKKGVVVYQKADKNGPVAGTVPDDLEAVHVDYATVGLNDGELYWNAFCFRKQTDKDPFFMLMGFILQDDLVFSE